MIFVLFYSRVMSGIGRACAHLFFRHVFHAGTHFSNRPTPLSLSFRLELIPPRGGVSHADPPSPLVSIISNRPTRPVLVRRPLSLTHSMYSRCSCLVVCAIYVWGFTAGQGLELYFSGVICWVDNLHFGLY